jgi:hypothetical protein
MNKKNVFNLVLLPDETLIGIQVINSQCILEDDTIKRVKGLELGFLFFKISFTRFI